MQEPGLRFQARYTHDRCQHEAILSRHSLIDQLTQFGDLLFGKSRPLCGHNAIFVVTFDELDHKTVAAAADLSGRS
jgi:hypothetical protein